MANDSDDVGDELLDADEVNLLGEVRAALEAVERQQHQVLRERRRLREQLDALLGALREDAAVLVFDTDGDLVEARGPLEEQIGVSADDLVSDLEDLVDEETVEALEEANRAVLDPDTSGASLSDGFFRSQGEEIAVTFIHLRRHDDDGEIVGTEAIGLVAPAAESDESATEVADLFEDLFVRVSRRLLDDAGARSVERAIETLGDFLGVDRVVVNRYDEEERKFSVMSSWLRGDTRPLDAEDRGISISELPWAYSVLGAGEAVAISDSAELPADAGAEKHLYGGDDVEASLLVPMVRGDHLEGFVSIQSARDPRAWTEQDIARARRFAVVLTAALASHEADIRLAEAREEAERTASESSEAQTRIAELEESEAEARDKLDELAQEVEEMRSRVTRLERDVEDARREEREARDAAAEAKSELEDTRRRADDAEAELSDLRKETGDAGSEIEALRKEAERAQRRSEDVAADASSAREELDEVRRQLDEARREAAELRAAVDRRAQPIDIDDEDAPAFDRTSKAGADRDRREAPAAVPGFGSDATEMRGRGIDTGGFDPDATLEMDSMSWDAQRAATDDRPEEESGARVDTPDVDDERDAVSGSEDLDELLETTQAGPEDDSETSAWKADKVSWEDSTGEVDLPEFLGPKAAADAEPDTDELEAAHDVARQVAGKSDVLDRDSSRDDATPDDGQTLDDLDYRSHDSRTDDHAVATFDVDADGAESPDRVERTGELEPFGASDGDEGDADEVPGDDAVVTLPDLPGIDPEIGLEDVGGNVELYRSLLTKFRSDYIGAGDKIGSAIEKGNIEVAHLLLHAVKGVAGVLGATRVRDSADDLETHLIGGDPDATSAAVDEFTGALDEVLTSIESLEAGADGDSATGEPVKPVGAANGSGQPSGAHVSDPMVLRSYLSGLRQHLLAEKPRQCMLVMREITARNWPDDYDRRVAELASLIDDGDFEDARDVFDGLMGEL